jgi:hypothetical protein
MKIFAFLTFLVALTSSAEAKLSDDFLCEAKTKHGESFEVVISNIEMIREVKLRNGTSSCSFQIESSFYSERSVAPQLVINFEAQKDCQLTNKTKALNDGFIKLIMQQKSEAYVLALIGHNPLPCKVKSLKLEKLLGDSN